MHQFERFSTLAHAPSERLQYFNQIAQQAYQGTRITSDDALFPAEMWRWRLGDLVMLRPRSPRATVERFWGAAGGEQSRLVLHIQHRGRTRIRQCGREAELGTGDMEINLAPEHYRLDLTGSNDILSVDMPTQPVLDRVPSLHDRTCRRIPAQSAAVQMLHGYVLSLWQSGQSAVSTEAWLDDAAEAFYCLVAAALRDGTDRRDDGELLVRLKATVVRRFDDPDLNTLTLATETGVSPRSVQTAFAADGVTPSAYISDVRLDRAAEWLRLYPSRSITDIALSVGFNDSAYFSRCFHSRFGVSPRDWRRD